MSKLLAAMFLAFIGAGMYPQAQAQAPVPTQAQAQTQPQAYPANPYMQNVPPISAPSLQPFPNMLVPMMGAFIPGMPRGTGPIASAPSWTMSVSPTFEQKTQFMKFMMPQLASMGFNMRDMMNFMTTKYQVREGVSFDEAVESMKLRANQVNLKLVGHSPMVKDIQAVLGDLSAPRMEVFHFCDIEVGREIMKLVPESIVFLPCRIAIMEDAQKKIWVLTLDWDPAWLDGINSSGMGLSPEMMVMAKKIRENMDNVMRAAAEGDL